MRADIHRITSLFGIKYPIIQAGMVWCSGWRLASAVSNAGGLGLIGAGSMNPELLKEHIVKCKAATTHPFGVNLPLLYSGIEKLIEVVIAEGVRIVFTSAGNPATWTQHLKSHGITVVHVVSSSRFAKKAEASGVDAIVAEGFEAGGHNGREETTTLVLIPLVRAGVTIPVIAAGGIGSGEAMLAAEALGADGFQVGSLFAATHESSAHEQFKNRVATSVEGDTVLTLKQLTPVRLIRNAFYERVAEAEQRGATKDELAALLGKRRSKLGIFDGDLDEGELEIGQIAAAIRSIKPASIVVEDLWRDYREARTNLSGKL
jgi:enoyl-[acyl-carrier protein] reductase II